MHGLVYLKYIDEQNIATLKPVQITLSMVKRCLFMQDLAKNTSVYCFAFNETYSEKANNILKF